MQNITDTAVGVFLMIASYLICVLNILTIYLGIDTIGNWISAGITGVAFLALWTEILGGFKHEGD